VSQSVCQSVSQLVSRSVNWSVSQSVCQSGYEAYSAHSYQIYVIPLFFSLRIFWVGHTGCCLCCLSLIISHNAIGACNSYTDKGDNCHGDNTLLEFIIIIIEVSLNFPFSDEKEKQNLCQVVFDFLSSAHELMPSNAK